MNNGILIKPLIDHRSDIPVLVDWFLKEWPEHYGNGGLGNAQRDIESYANNDILPVGLVAYRNNELCGIMALKEDSISSLSHLGPWVAAGYVAPEFRDQGIGGRLLSGVEKVASNMGFSQIYSGTSLAHGLLLRANWVKENEVVQAGNNVSIYTKKL